jgi:uncharacterized protein (DUF362 family)
MEGPGPIRGNPKQLGWLVASADPMAAEIVCCDLIGLTPEYLPLIKTAGKIGFGCTNKHDIQIIGDSMPADWHVELIPAEQTPLRFTPARIVKSILRQIFILAKSERRS